MKNQPIVEADVAASFQKAVVDVLVEHSMWAIDEYGFDKFAIAGGVASNFAGKAARAPARPAPAPGGAAEGRAGGGEGRTVRPARAGGLRHGDGAQPPQAAAGGGGPPPARQALRDYKNDNDVDEDEDDEDLDPTYIALRDDYRAKQRAL